MMSDSTNSTLDRKIEILIDQVGQFAEGLTEFRLVMQQNITELKDAIQRSIDENQRSMAEFRAENQRLAIETRAENQRLAAETRAEMQRNTAEFRADLAEIKGLVREQAETSKQQAETVAHLVKVVDALIQRAS